MLQRPQSQLGIVHNFQQKLLQSQQQLDADFYQLAQLRQQIKRNRITTVQCSNILQEMIQKISHPLLGIQLIKDKFEEMGLFENVGFKAFESIQFKAEAIYVEVLMGDLKKMVNEERVEEFSRDQVKNIIEEINWKIGMEKSIHESRVEQVGQHVELMKFFEGVRNYQNWNQNVKKQTIQKLKHKAHEIQLNLTLKKGFLMSKIQKITKSYTQHYEQQFIQKCRKISKLHAIPKICQLIQKQSVRQSFGDILLKSIELKDSQKLGIMFEKYWQTKVVSKIGKEVGGFLKRQYKNKLFAGRLLKVFEGKRLKNYAVLMEKINFKRKVKSCNVFKAIDRINATMERKLKLCALKQLNVTQIKIFKLLAKSTLGTLSLAFNSIKSQAQSNRVTVTPLSLRLRGKVLNSLPTPQSKPIDIRQTFMNWYIKGNERKFSKQIYNIWLTGTTSKFTFFMRMKNLIDQNRNYIVKYEMKLFLMLFGDKMGKYVKQCQKTMMQKWLKNTRRVNRIQKMFDKLGDIQLETFEVLKKVAFQRLIKVYQASLTRQKYCTRYLSNHASNLKHFLSQWRSIPDYKKSKGKAMMRKIFASVIQQIHQSKKQAYTAFKHDYTQGHEKKIKVLNKAFNLDSVYLQRYFQKWRVNKNSLIKQGNDFESQKQKTLLFLQKFHKTQYKKNIKDIINKFRVKSVQQKTRSTKTKKLFINILQRNKSQTMIHVYLIFKNCWEEGKLKKNNLVKWFVEANKRSQLQALYTIKAKSTELYNLEKIKMTEMLFAVSENCLKDSIKIFDKSQFIYNFLTKIIVNRCKNIEISLKNIQALPNRMNWKKRDNAIKLFQALMHQYKRNKGFTFAKYKQNLLKGNFKMTKSMDIMAAKYFDVTRRYFNTYRKNVSRIKNDEINKSIGTSFENMDTVLQGNLKTLFIGQAQWKKKADHLAKLNARIKDRVGQTFKLWRQTSKAMAYFNHIQNEKKTRYFEILMKALNNNQLSETKKAIGLFKKHATIQDIQLQFLRRLCDTQAGKVVKAMMIWKNLPEQKNKQKIARATKFEQMMARIGVKNFKKSFLAFKDGHYHGNERKKYCIRQLVAKSSSGLKSYFEKWRGNSKLSIIFGRCEAVSHLIHIGQHLAQQNWKLLFEGNEASQKRQKLHKLDLILLKQKKQLINLWRQKNTQIRKHNKRKGFLITRLTQIQQSTENKNVRDFVVKKFLQVRIQRLLQKQRFKQARLLSVIDHAVMRRKQNVSQSFEAFRFNLHKGNFKKKRAFENWLKDKIAHISGILGGWNGMAQESVLADKRKIVSHNFEQMDIITRANFNHLIANRRQMELKKKMLSNLFKSQELKMKGSFEMWRNYVKQIKIWLQLDKTAKSSILERINKIVSIGSEQNVKKAILKFHQSMKIEQVQRKFINQLLKTKSGMVHEAVKKWKSIPAINLGEKYKKAQKFFHKLENMHKKHLGFVHNVFKKQGQEATMVKKQAILQLFDMTSTGIRRYYRRWEKMSKQKHTLNCVHQLMKSLEVMNGVIANQYMIVFQDQRAYKIKTNAINKLILAAQGTTANYFNKWRDVARQMKIEEGLDVTKKTLALQMFTRALEGSEKNQVVQTIQKFKTNAIVTDISKKFFNRLLQTKTGKLVQFFQKFKTIPDAKVSARKKKAIKFQTTLNRFAMRILRTSFNPFKTCNYLAVDRKKYCINKLVRNSMGQQFKSFTRWRNVTRQDKVLSHSYLTQKAFSNMQSLLSDGLGMLCKDYKQEIEKKKNLCRKLTMNSQFVQHHAFMIWKESVRIDDVKNIKHESKVREVLKNLMNIHNSQEKKSAIGGFGQFRNVLMLQKLQKAQKAQKQKHNTACQFYQILQKLKNNRMMSLISSCKNSAVQMNFANKLSSLESFFHSSSEIYAQNLMMLFRNERQTIIIQNALDRIFRNFKVGTEKAFNIWRQNARVIKLQQQMGAEKKKNILDILNKVIDSRETVNVKRSIELFNIHAKQQKIQKQILMKILNCKAGKVPILFMKWKALPSQTGKKYKMKAIKFQSAFFRTWNKRMKFVYQSFKTQSYDATVKKQFAIKRLINVTQSDSSRIFNKWRKVNNETKITQKMISLDKLFSISQQKLVSNMEIFNNFRQQQTVKFSALQRLFLVQEAHLRDSLKSWIDQNKNFKFQTLTNVLKKYTQEQLNKRFVKQTFNMVKQRFEVQTMKGYINSLWRWKMTNTENQFYDKFIKVFSQSEELLNLSKIMNKKQNDTLHLAFAQIKNAAKQRFERKVYLVEKLLTKKAKTYFERMRAHVYREEISTWKSMYTQVVKVQGFLGLITKIFRRQENDIFTTLKQNEKYLQKTQKLFKSLQSYKSKNLQQSFKNVFKYGYIRIIRTALETRNKVKNYLLSEAFNEIIEMGKLRHFGRKIANVQKSSMIRRTFATIRKNSERLVKQKLGLLLLIDNLNQKKHSNKIKAVKSFERRKLKCIVLEKISQIILQKVHERQRQFFHTSQQDFKVIMLLSQFKKGTALKNILQKQNKRILKTYLQRLRKKQNKWIGQSIRRFATRSSLRSSVAVSLWRLKTFAEH